MKILVCRCFGLGNAVLSIPMIRAIQSLASVDCLDVLVGNTFDDLGSFEVLHEIPTKGQCYQGSVPLEKEYDVAILSIPFDGRWVNGRDFKAERVMDGRARPDPSTSGFVSWKKSEVEYQMETAYALGFKGEIPSLDFFQRPRSWNATPTSVYIGVGYKKDQAGFWKQKHWGNENFADLIKKILQNSPDKELEDFPDLRWKVCSTGNELDEALSLHPIQKILSKELSRNDIRRVNFFPMGTSGRYWAGAFEILSRCSLYVGNDTGMMHIAASMGIPTVGIFMMEGAQIKSPPFGQEQNLIYSPGKKPSVDEVYEKVRSLL